MSFTVITDEQYILQADTKRCQHSRSAAGKKSCKQITENNNVQFFHSSAVKLSNLDIILRGSLPTPQGTTELSILACIAFRSFLLNRLLSSHAFLKTRFDVPNSKLCMGSIIANLILS